MLGKMMIHGLVAAILIGGAAAVYAQAKADGAVAPAGNGYLQPGTDGARTDGTRADGTRTDRDGHKKAARSERHAEGRGGHDKQHDHDD